jgi:hypothetical protein
MTHHTPHPKNQQTLQNQLKHEGLQDTDTDQPQNWTQITQQAQTELHTLTNLR